MALLHRIFYCTVLFFLGARLLLFLHLHGARHTTAAAEVSAGWAGGREPSSSTREGIVARSGCGGTGFGCDRKRQQPCIGWPHRPHWPPCALCAPWGSSCHQHPSPPSHCSFDSSPPWWLVGSVTSVDAGSSGGGVWNLWWGRRMGSSRGQLLGGQRAMETGEQHSPAMAIEIGENNRVRPIS
uniref:Uncharacterized protein n=1 Tax=Arundo donax TaxID=35708 RepID=A0A0A9BJL2_ARUDO